MAKAEQFLISRSAGLTTGASAFIAGAQRAGRQFIPQPYELYSEENHAAWCRRYAGMESRWVRHANTPFLRGLEALRLDPYQVPRLEDINRFLGPRTGFRAVGVSGCLPVLLFFECLSRRELPTAVTMRDVSQPCSPAPDIFQDIAGQIPMHTDPAFADVLVQFGRCAHAARERVSGVTDEAEKDRRMASMIRAVTRVFGFTIKRGLMRGPEGLKVYGSALLSTRSAMDWATDPARVRQNPFQLEEAVNQGCLSDAGQTRLFVVDSFDHLFSLMEQLEAWIRQGKLDGTG